MKDNKDLNPFANKQLASIDIVFENYEIYNIPADGIYKLSVGNIKYSFDVHVNGLSKYTTPGEMWTYAYTDFVWLALNKKGMNVDSGWADMFEDEENKPFCERVKANDITHLDFIFDDGSNLYVSVPWEDGNTEFNNKLQKNDIRDDILFIQIAEKQEISDNELKEINDGQEDIYHWDTDEDKPIEILDGGNNSHYCCQCGEEATKELNNGKYACDNCLNNLGKEQQELKEEIENSLFDFGFDNYEDITNCIDIFIDFIKYAKAWSTIKNLDHLDKSLEAINLSIKMKNGLLDKETEEKIKELAQNW